MANNDFKSKLINYIGKDTLLDALIESDYLKVESFIEKGKRFENIDEGLFQRALYEFLADYDMMLFLVNHGFNIFHFRHVFCRDDRGRAWGIVARAYFLNRRDIIDLLFSVGFNLLDSNEFFWMGNESVPRLLWKYVLLEKFDKEIIDLMLSYGEDFSSTSIGYLDDDQRAYNYVNSNPKINWKGYALCSKWQQEIPEPIKPYFGIFTTKRKREALETLYNKEYEEYLEKVRVRREYINSITDEEWKLIDEQKEVERLANQYWIQMRK